MSQMRLMTLFFVLLRIGIGVTDADTFTFTNMGVVELTKGF